MSDISASPSTRKLALQKGVDLEARARKLGRTTIGPEDIDSAAAPPSPAGAGASAGAGAASGAAQSSYWDVDHSQYGPVTEEKTTRFDQVAARNLAAAHALIPAVTHHDRAQVCAIEALRKAWQPEARARGVKLTALAFHVAALARTLKDFPRFNASLSADGRSLILKHYVHIGIAVDTPHGLMVPVLRDADKKGLWRIAQDIAELAARAQDRKLAPEHMGGASMTITNLGGIGGTGFTPIVNPPELAILGITRTQTVTEWHNSTPKPVKMTPLDLSYDHRAINGANAANFLNQYSKYITHPNKLII